MKALIFLFFISLSTFSYSQFDEKFDFHAFASYVNIETDNLKARDGYGLSGKIMYNFTDHSAFRVGYDVVRFSVRGRDEFTFINDSSKISNSDIPFALRGFEHQIAVEYKYNYNKRYNPNWYLTIGTAAMRKILLVNLVLDTEPDETKELAEASFTNLTSIIPFNINVGMGLEVHLTGGRGLVFEANYKYFKNSHVVIAGTDKILSNTHIPYIGTFSLSAGLIL